MSRRSKERRSKNASRIDTTESASKNAQVMLASKEFGKESLDAVLGNLGSYQVQYGGKRDVRLQKLYNNKRLTDIKFKLDDGSIVEAHRLVLSLQSPVFASMFYGSFEECEQSAKCLEMDVCDVSSIGFRFIVDEIYGGNGMISKENVMHVLSAANLFQVESAAVKCIEYLLRGCEGGHTCDIYRLVPLWIKDKTCEENCLASIAKSFERIAESTSILYLSPYHLRKVLDYDLVGEKSELLVFSTLVKWAKFQAVLQHPEMRTKPSQSPDIVSLSSNIPVPAEGEGYYFEDDRRRILISLNFNNDSPIVQSQPPCDASDITREFIVQRLKEMRVQSEQGKELQDLKQPCELGAHQVKEFVQSTIPYFDENETYEETVKRLISTELLHACRLGLLSIEELAVNVEPLQLLTSEEMLELFRHAARSRLAQDYRNATVNEVPTLSVCGFSAQPRLGEVENADQFRFIVESEVGSPGSSNSSIVATAQENADFIPTRLSSMVVFSSDGRTISKGNLDQSSPSVTASTKPLVLTGREKYVFWQVSVDRILNFTERDFVGFQIKKNEEKEALLCGILVGSQKPSNQDAMLGVNFASFPSIAWQNKDRIGFLFETLTGNCLIFRNEEYLSTLKTETPIASVTGQYSFVTAKLSPYVVLTTNAFYTLEVKARPPLSLRTGKL